MKARPAAAVSTKLIRAMPRAAGQSCCARLRSGRAKLGSPAWTVPTSEIPHRSSPARPDRAMPTATVVKEAGSRGVKCLRPSRRASIARASINVGKDVSGRCLMIETMSWKKPALAICTSRSLGAWSSTMTMPIPALNPVSTGSEIRLASMPSLRSPPSSRKVPTRSDRVADADISMATSPPGATAPRALAARMAMVELVVTLRRREVPSTAYTTSMTSEVYRPTTSGRPAMAA